MRDSMWDRRVILACRRDILRKREMKSNCDGATCASRLKPRSPATPIARCCTRRGMDRCCPPPFAIRRGAFRGCTLWQKVGFYEWMPDLYMAISDRCVYFRSREGRFGIGGLWFDILPPKKRSRSNCPSWERLWAICTKSWYYAGWPIERVIWWKKEKLLVY